MKALPLPEASKPTFSGSILSDMSMSNQSFWNCRCYSSLRALLLYTGSVETIATHDTDVLFLFH